MEIVNEQLDDKKHVELGEKYNWKWYLLLNIATDNYD